MPRIALLTLALLTLLTGSAAGAARHTANLQHVANLPGEGSGDIAFWGETLVQASGTDDGDAGNDGFRLIDISRPGEPRVISSFICAGSAYDVGIWDTLVFLSVNAPAPRTCDPAGADGETDAPFFGVRVVSIADPARPRLVANIECAEPGSHTHTIVPDLTRGRLLIDANSVCIGEVPLAEPAQARTLRDEPPAGVVEGCHDITHHVDFKLAAGGCDYGLLKLFDTNDPANARLIGQAAVPFAENAHNTAFSNDGKVVAIGTENIHTSITNQCPADPFGRVYFYDIADPANPVMKGSVGLPAAGVDPGYCTAHQFNVIPTRDDRDVLAIAWYHGGMTLVDFTDPAAPRTIGEYAPERSLAWSAYYYRGHIYMSHLGRLQFDGIDLQSGPGGLDVLAVDDPALAGAIDLPYLNAQTQFALPAADARPAPATSQTPRTAPAQERLRVRVRPRRVRVGRAIRISVTVRSSAGRPVARAEVRLGGHRARTNRRGVAVLRYRAARGERRRGLVVSAPGYRSVVATLRVVR